MTLSQNVLNPPLAPGTVIETFCVEKNYKSTCKPLDDKIILLLVKLAEAFFLFPR